MKHNYLYQKNTNVIIHHDKYCKKHYDGNVETETIHLHIGEKKLFEWIMPILGKVGENIYVRFLSFNPEKKIVGIA